MCFALQNILRKSSGELCFLLWIEAAVGMTVPAGRSQRPLGSVLGQLTGEQTYAAGTRTGFLTVLSVIPAPDTDFDPAGRLQDVQLLLGCSNSSILRQLQLVQVTKVAPPVGCGRM